MDTQIYFGKDLVFKDLIFEKDTEVLKFLSSELVSKGYVKEEFQNAILEREKQYPTALPSQEIIIAIPHADHTLVKKAAIAIGMLKNPVEFRSMEDPDKKLMVNMVIMLALDQPHGHIEMLQKIVKLIQNQEVLKKIMAATTKADAMNMLEPFLLG
ncbi:PTS sugar transporter subunit IIA [Clostridium polynesiense]|uniref:PTS sugar transporter subunit IIA n=1 Tax=Clostridium polynesiense TaxID=1325933 RepID=UPI00058D5551|nr:PTS sugar transporter subunit IIA [Clostridium polynesiense]